MSRSQFKDPLTSGHAPLEVTFFAVGKSFDANNATIGNFVLNAQKHELKDDIIQNCVKHSQNQSLSID